MVVAHGIHHLGMDEPRLVSFSRAMAGSGFAVLTPQLASLADYRVDSDSIATIGESPAWLEARLGAGPVTLAGVSFAGGLALLAAGDPSYAPHVRAVFVMGGYDDLNRVARFLVTDQAELPDGRLTPYTAHEYGALVFVYAHLDQFFSAADLPAAHEALRLFLWEQPSDAQLYLRKLSSAGRATMDTMLTHHVDRLRPQILAAISADGPELSALSPEGRLGNLRVPVYILHGSTDDIIPSTESLWLEKEMPAPQLGAVLITPAFAHVDPEKKVAWYDELRLVHFMARILRAAS
jgi:pimeloyl-ACP methyl ester carboxylesterase